MKTIGLVVKADDKALQIADQFQEWLTKKGHKTVRKQLSPPHHELGNLKSMSSPPDLFCVFVFGGDGTFLSAVRWIGDQVIPLIGVKFGEVGFLAEATEDNFIPAAKTILAGNFTTLPRMRLDVTVLRENVEIKNESVLNDVVINKGVLARLAQMETYVDDKYITEYRADGLIISTPTGSTAYSLAAGGPIIHPSVQGILISPICPFTLTNRPLIVPENVCIQIKVSEKSSGLILTFDGQIGLKIDQRDTVVIKKSKYPVHFITLPYQDYFDVLKAKLQWSGSRI